MKKWDLGWLRALRFDRVFSLFFVVNLGIGFSSFLLTQSLKDSLVLQLANNEKAYLSADLSISARRNLSQKELAPVQDFLRESARDSGAESVSFSDLYETFSMGSSAAGSRLVQVKAVDDQYPFYGDIQLKVRGLVGEAAQPLQFSTTKPEAIVYPEVLLQFGISVGDALKVGNLDFQVVDVIERDSTQTFRLAGLAPKVYIHQRWAEKAGFLSEGATLTHAMLVKVVGPWNSIQADSELEGLIKDNSIDVTSPKEAAEQTARVLLYLSDYLSLASIVSLALTLIGIFYLAQQWRTRRLKSWAIEHALGRSTGQLVRRGSVELFFLSSLGVLVALILASGLLPILEKTLAGFVPAGFNASITLKSVLLTWALCLFVVSLVLTPLISILKNIPTNRLFSEGDFSGFSGARSWLQVFSIVLVFALVMLLTWISAKSLMVSALFLGLSLGAVLLTAVVIWIAIRSTRSLKSHSSRTWIWQSLSRIFSFYPVRTILIVTSLTLGVLLLNLLPQIKSGLSENLEKPESGRIPSLFLFDIQDDQVEGLRLKVKELGSEFQSLAPMIRGRLRSINGEAVEKSEPSTEPQTREQERSERLRNRGVNLSYRTELAPWETLQSGKWTMRGDQTLDSEAELSLEEDYAESLGARLGDVLTFDIQGIVFSGRVQSMRKVKWNSFQPNFFILLDPGVLIDAPKIWIATLPAMAREQAEEFQKKLVGPYPNVSMIDVGRLVERVIEIMGQMQAALQIMSFLCLFAGLALIWSIIWGQKQARQRDFYLYHLLGASPGQIQKWLEIEFLVLAAFAVVLGAAFSLVCNFVLSLFVFDGAVSISWTWIGISSAVVLGMVWLLTRTGPGVDASK